jgi:hypothetical protein
MRRGQDFDVLEDAIPIFDIKASVRAEKPVKSVALVPEQNHLEFAWKNGILEFVIPRLEGHRRVAIQF